MPYFSANRPGHLLLGVLVATFALGACVEPIEQTGSPASVDSIGAARIIQPREASAPYSQVAVPYVLCDMDLDDVDVDVEICNVVTKRCGAPVQGFGSDGTVALPTRPCELGGSDHIFVWDACAGIMDASNRTLARPDPSSSYSITIHHGSSSQATEAFGLGDVGLVELAANCDGSTE